jgi:hypothetical protein
LSQRAIAITAATKTATKAMIAMVSQPIAKKSQILGEQLVNLPQFRKNEAGAVSPLV